VGLILLANSFRGPSLFGRGVDSTRESFAARISFSVGAESEVRPDFVHSANFFLLVSPVPNSSHRIFFLPPCHPFLLPPPDLEHWFSLVLAVGVCRIWASSVLTPFDEKFCS
jgi:hypothetical protein